ncbi:PREDICTED: uncharacterized protein LOC105563290 [Vollenhovia emeryi]|uniref:uncharacterized protein LOC105563290 n=1 Tax=Vollenhovia emeryi TaxID=411798 RepID=UPI0005F4D977|nr:PREDICTED: uncharacterized protein LOC105563290 [Vollenhovia emeryi]
MVVDILSIGGEPIFDERIVKIETQTYNPYANATVGYSDEVRIPIQQQDLYTLPCESTLYVEGKLSDEASTTTTTNQTSKLTSNCVAFIFDEIRYELNGVEIDRNRNVGITSTIKNYISLTSNELDILQNAGRGEPTVSDSGSFSLCVPMRILLGFCEDYKRVVVNARHELILIRARNDNNCIVATASAKNPKIVLSRVQWRMPHIVLNDVNKLSLLRTLESGRFLSVGFRSWDLYEFPVLQSTTKHSWAVKTTAQLEKPRYVIFALQTGRRNVLTSDSSTFDHCKFTNVKLYLNSDFYPYDDMNLDIDNNKFAILYDMYAKFQRSYYGRKLDDAYLNVKSFITSGPFVVIDCSRQNEAVKSAIVDIRVEF